MERKGNEISHAEYRLGRGKPTMSRIRKDTHMDVSELVMGGEGDIQVFNIKYLLGRKLRLVNVYDW